MKQKTVTAIILLISVLLLFSTFSSFSALAETRTFGYSQIGQYSDMLISGYKDSCRYQASESGVINSMSMYIQTANAQVRFGVYSDLNGKPNQLLAQSSQVSTSGNQWVTASLTASVVAGQYYWFTVTSTATIKYTFDYASGGSSGYAIEPTTTMSSNYGAFTSWTASKFSMYAAYTPANSPTPVPTTVPTASPTPTPTSAPTPTPSPTPTPTPTPTLTPTPTPVVTQSSSSTLTKLSYYCSASTIGKAKCFIYDAATGALLGSSSEVTVNQTPMWRDYVISGVQISPGATYLLAFMGNVQLNTPYADDSVAQWVYTGSGSLTYPNVPTTFKVQGSAGARASIYATYTTATGSSIFGDSKVETQHIDNMPVGWLSAIKYVVPANSNSPQPTATPSPTPTPTSTPTRTPTPTPTPTPSPNLNKNFAVIPTFWANPTAWGLRAGGYCTYPVSWQGVANCFKIAYNPEYNDFCDSNGWLGCMNEIDGNNPNFQIHAGDHIVYRVVMWTEDSTCGYNAAYCSIGSDIWTNAGRVAELGADGVQGHARAAVHWGSNGWVTVTIDFHVANSYVSDGEGDVTQPKGTVVYVNNQPTYLVPFMQTWGKYTGGTCYERANVYVRSTELYINPQ